LTEKNTEFKNLNSILIFCSERFDEGIAGEFEENLGRRWGFKEKKEKLKNNHLF